MQAKVHKLDIMKIINFVKRMNRQERDWEKIFPLTFLRVGILCAFLILI